MRKILLALTASALATAGCGRNAANSSGGVILGSYANGTGRPEVTDICDVSSLEAAKDSYASRSSRLRNTVTSPATANSQGSYGSSGAQSGDSSASATGNRSSSATGNGSSSTSYDKSEARRTLSRINSFDAEIDAKYRSVVASCRAFSRCMQNNYYDEGQCRSTMMRWENADRDFSSLARELREIEAEVENLRTVSRGRYRGYRPVNKCESGVCY